ncbi:putative leucine-rich repeat-containing protein DDB_G0290503 isoform X1 [Magallana gigas]|uniref:putative leucine-rich repeat-containing protein DDB_G0290503 isoform X1 n=1 Tax=Magallana gigas TaxID=29159 RepID=UPI00333F9597
MELVFILVIWVGFIWAKADSSRLTDNNKTTTLQENKTPDCYEISFLRQMINQETVIRLALVKNVHALVNDISILKESFAASETKISELQRTVDALNIQVNSLQQENGQLKKSSLISQAKSMELETKFQNVSDNVSALHGQLNVIRKESDDKRQEVFNKTNAVLDDIKIEVRYLSVTLLDFKERTEIENESRDKKYSELERHSNTSIESLKVKNSLTKEFGNLKSFVQNLQDSQTEITENINRAVARFDVQFTLSEHTQHNFSSALASLETAQTKLSKSIDENLNRTVARFDTQFTLSEHTQQTFSSALASLETAQTKLSKSIDENLNRTVARFDVQFTLSEHTQQTFSSALASLETAQTKLSKSIDENLNRTVAKFDTQFTLSEHTQQKFSSALASLETAQTKLSKSTDDKSNHHAFTAGMSSSNNGWTGDTLVFPAVIYSEGTGYNPSTGIFTAPTAGTYVFYVSVQSANQKYIYLDIVMNGYSKVKAMAWYGSGSSISIYQTGTNLVILHLQTGDRVWVKRSAGTGYQSNFIPITTFSGFKLN